MNRSYLLRHGLGLIVIVCSIAALLSWTAPAPVYAVGEAATSFGMYIPPNASYATRDPGIIVTAVQDGTLVDIIDDGADGDTDDTSLGVALAKGQSYITFIQNGTVNDDFGGPVATQGDYFRITSNKPVLVMNLTVNTAWEHEFVPADNKKMTGQSFYLYTPNVTSGATLPQIDVFAFNDNTDVTLLDLTNTADTNQLDAGYTTIKSDTAATVFLTTTLQTGQDLREVNNLKPNLVAGHTYHLLANKDVTVQFGSLGKADSNSRDGGGYVPGKNGYSADKTFYFVIPYFVTAERELRVVSYNQPASVHLRGWNTITRQWDVISDFKLETYGHADFVGAELGGTYYLFELTSDTNISAFEANWLETSTVDYATADIATFISSEAGTGAGSRFLAYMAPPAVEPLIPAGGTTQRTHLYLYARQNTAITAYDPDSYGEWIELYNRNNAPQDIGGWTLTVCAAAPIGCAQSQALVIPAGEKIAAHDYYLLEYHQKATEVAANYVWSAANSAFRLGNGGGTLTLSAPTGYTDSINWNDTGWGVNHGNFYSLERANPALPFTTTNYHDGSLLHANSATNDNLGAFYGTPKAANTGVVDNATGNVVINELMTGRIYRTLTIAANGYSDFFLSIPEWEGLFNGDTPPGNQTLGDPEAPYIVVEGNHDFSVLNTNWNDNWLTFGTGVLSPDPRVNYQADYYQRAPGQPVNFTAYVQNQGDALNAAVTEITLPPQMTYTPGSYTTPAILAGTVPTETQNADGSWTITWAHNRPLGPSDGILIFNLRAIVKTTAPLNAALYSAITTRGQDPTGSRYASQDSVVVTVGPDESANVGNVVINEVLPAPNTGTEWIELYNKTTTEINLGSWELTNEENWTYRIPDLTFLPADSYLRIVLGAGVDGGGVLYTGALSTNNLNDAEDQVSLYTGATHSWSTLSDFVQWDSDSTLSRPQDQTNAVLAVQWSANTYVPRAAVGQSLGRSRASADGNTVADWDNTGGPDADLPTPGKMNLRDTTPTAEVSNLAAVSLRNHQVQLTWINPPQADFQGVRILRKTTGYPTTITDGSQVYEGPDTVFVDSGLADHTRYYYTLFAFDTALNFTAGAPVSAVSSQQSLTVWEDLKNKSWLDWDENDLVVKSETVQQIDANGNLTEIALYYEALARGACYVQTYHVNIPINGNAGVTVRRLDPSGIVLGQEQRETSGLVNATIFTDTRVALPANLPNQPAPENCFGNTSKYAPSQLAGQQTELVITLRSPASNPFSPAVQPPYDPYLRVLNTNQTIHLQRVGSVGDVQEVMDGPLAGRAIAYGLEFNFAWNWPLERIRLWQAYPRYVNYVTSGSTLDTDWYNFPVTWLLWKNVYGQTPPAAVTNVTLDPNLIPGDITLNSPSDVALTDSSLSWTQTTGGLIFSSPTLADLNGDGQQEIVVGSRDGYIYALTPDGLPLPNWPVSATGSVRASVSVGDLDQNGSPEIVAGTETNKLYVWEADGTIRPGFPVDLGNKIKSTAALADLNQDGTLDIVVLSGDAKVYAVQADGTLLPGWPQTTNGQVDKYGNLILGSTPAVADLDGDQQPEVVVGSTDGQVYAWHADGTPLAGWPVMTADWVYPSPAIGDLDRDGQPEVIVGSGDGKLYAVHGDGTPVAGWPVDLGEAMVSSAALGDLNNDGALEVAVATLMGHVYVLNADGTLVPGWPQTTQSQIYSSPALADVSGDGQPDVLVGSKDNRLYAWSADGNLVTGFPKLTNDWILSSPAVGDLNNDGLTEVVVGSYDKKIYLWGLDTPWNPSAAPWPMFHQDALHNGVKAIPVIAPTLPPALYLPWISR